MAPNGGVTLVVEKSQEKSSCVEEPKRMFLLALTLEATLETQLSSLGDVQ
jgi:hypothetical protein